MCGCSLVQSSCSPISIDYIYTTKHVLLYQKINDETFAQKNRLKMMPPLILIYNFWKCVLVDLLSTYTGPSGCILLLSVEQL